MNTQLKMMDDDFCIIERKTDKLIICGDYWYILDLLLTLYSTSTHYTIKKRLYYEYVRKNS